MNEEILKEFDNNTFKIFGEEFIPLTEENAKKGELEKVNISLKPNINLKSILIRSERLSIDKLFNQQTAKGKNRRCDYILISQEKVYFIELKTTYKDSNKDNEYYINQFKGALCISNYIDSVLVNFYQTDKEFHNIDKRFVLFAINCPVPKTDTSRKDLRSQANNTEPEKFKIIKVTNDDIIHLERLG